MSQTLKLRCLAVLSCLAVPAFAQDALSEDDRFDEIVVTADYRGRTVENLPASITVIDASVIENSAVQHFEELVSIVPNLNWSGDGHRARYFQIRGVGELEQYQGAPNPSVGFLIDDIDFSGIGTVATLFDIGTVEVLRGPQGSRYGANALGGLIYMRSTMPSAERDGRIQLTAGDDDARAAGIAFGGAVGESDTAAFRVSLHRHESNGFRDNTFLDRSDTNGRDETSVRARLQLVPTDNLEANIAIVFADIDNGYDAFAIDNSYTMLSDKPGEDSQRSIGTSMRLDWAQLGNGSLTSITSAARSDIGFGFDADWGNDDSWAPVLYDYISMSHRERQTLSQELRYASGQWIVGVYALRLTDDLDTYNAGEYYDPFYDWADSLDYPFASRYESTNVAAFGQFESDASRDTRFSAGLRVERRSSDYRDTDGLEAGPSETLWGGEISVVHDLSGDVAGYVTASRGFKAGGFNLGVVPDNWRRFGDEAMWTLETGVKSSFDNGVGINASVFHLWREEQQVRASFQLLPNDPASFGFATINVDGATNYGAEAEITWQATEFIQVQLGAGLLYGGFPGSVAEFPWLERRDQAHAPRHSISAAIDWRHPGGWFARLDVAARDEFYFDVSHNQTSEAYELVNARVGFENENWRVALWGRNVTDEYYAVRGFYFGNEPPDFPPTLYTRTGDPRHIGVTLERRF